MRNVTPHSRCLAPTIIEAQYLSALKSTLLPRSQKEIRSPSSAPPVLTFKLSPFLQPGESPGVLDPIALPQPLASAPACFLNSPSAQGHLVALAHLEVRAHPEEKKSLLGWASAAAPLASHPGLCRHPPGAPTSPTSLNTPMHSFALRGFPQATHTWG